MAVPSIDLNLDGDGAWPDLRDRPVIHLQEPWQLVALPAGMTSGKPSLALRLDLPDGSSVVAETSLDIWIATTAALRGRFPESFADGPLRQQP